MSASLKAHCRIMEVVRQGNPTEDIRRLRVFAWAVTALLICGSPLLSQWLTVIAGVLPRLSTGDGQGRIVRVPRPLITLPRPAAHRAFS